MTWYSADSWVKSLNFNGIAGWHLPDMSADFCAGFNCTQSEMGNMYYITLGNRSGNLTNTGPLRNLEDSRYWSIDNIYEPEEWAFAFGMGDGYQDNSYDKTIDSYHTWAVHSGDVGASVIPVPASVWLFGSGLIGLVGMARRKKAA